MNDHIEDHLWYLLWVKRSEWNTLEAILLQMGFDPSIVAPTSLLRSFTTSSINGQNWWVSKAIPKFVTDFSETLGSESKTFLQLYSLAKVDLGTGKIQNSMSPEFWIRWFIEQGMSIDRDLWRATTSQYPDFAYEASMVTGDGRMDAFKKKEERLNEYSLGRIGSTQTQKLHGDRMNKGSKNIFVIMQIGNEELDKIFNDIFLVVFKEIDPEIKVKRVDKDNEGGILKKEIVEFIKGADLILADLTNERPNCYLEVGIAMGLDISQGFEKFPKIILSAREDHNPHSPNFRPGQPKIHFDLSGYDITFWDPKNLEKFKSDLKDKAQTRLKQIESRPKHSSVIPLTINPVIEKLHQVKKEAKPIRITPIFPIDYADRDFRIEKILEIGEVEVQKLDSNHHILISVSKIKDVIRNINQPTTIQIEGRIQLVSILRSWRYFPENPIDEFGISKTGTDMARISEELRKRGIESRYCSLRELGSKMSEMWQIFYDVDGRYIRRPDKSSDQIFCIPKPRMLI